MSKQIKAIIFDFDGVVINSEPLYEQTGRELFRQYGVEISDNDWQEFRGLTANDFFYLAKKKFNLTADIAEISELDHKILKNKFSKQLNYISGFNQFFENIKSNYQTALVTSTSQHLLEWIYTNTKINNHFNISITGSDVNNPKPHPEPFQKTAKILKICPTEMIVIEDSVNGVISAKEAGSKVIGFLTSFDRKILKDADYFAKDYSEVEEIVANLY